MIHVQNLTRRFGRKAALDDISFDVLQGEIVGFLGPNGAGKTTLMRVLSCYLSATSGDVRIDGLDAAAEALEVRKRIGYLPENVPLYTGMRVSEYLRFRAALKGLRGRRARVRIKEVISDCGLGGVRQHIIGCLSKGYRQRVGLADVLVHEPDLLILDEPTIGLDPNQIRQVRHLIRNLAPRHTVILSSHILSEAEAICDRVLIINEGKIAAAGTPEDLSGLLKGDVRVVAEIRGMVDDDRGRISELPGVMGVSFEAKGDWVKVTCDCDRRGRVREGIFRVAVEGKWDIRELTEERQGLEDVFAQMTGGGK